MICKLLKKCIFLFLMLFSIVIYAQNESIEIKNASEPDWFISAGLGVQMSGIKDEDFVGHNRAPLVNIMAGKWFSPELALQIGYKGPYYNAIADDKKHHYYFLYGEALMNINSFFKSYSSSDTWRLLVHAGAGYYYNHDYSQPNVCANMGITNGFRISKCLQANLDVSAISGWNIYQGDEDILPGISAGILYLF